MSILEGYEIFINTCGKKVKITYVPYQQLETYNNKVTHAPKMITRGTIENMTPERIYIVNQNGCFEIFQLNQIVEMVEIKDQK